MFVYCASIYGKRVEVWSSTDGASWAYERDLDYSVVGPTAVTTGLNGNNAISEWN